MAYPGNKLQTIGDIYLIDLCIQYLLVPILRLFVCMQLLYFIANFWFLRLNLNFCHFVLLCIVFSDTCYCFQFGVSDLFLFSKCMNFQLSFLEHLFFDVFTMV